MPIHVILGKPGSGKSLYATMRLIRELLEGNRNVVTNLPIRVDRLNEYLQEAYPKANTRLVERLRILDDEEIKKFWAFRGPGNKEDASSGVLTLGEAPHGVAYFLDEAHIAFNARDWASIGRGCLNYLSQHRKLGDIVWPITQAPGNLDKQFRSVAEDFTVLRNEYTAKYGIFKGRGRFVRRTYLQEPTGKAEPFETATFTLDVKGVASCYDTAKGIGVHGSKADIGRRAKGIPIWVVIPGALVLALGCVFVPWLMGKGAAKFVEGDARKKGVPVATASGGSDAAGLDADPRYVKTGERNDVHARPIDVQQPAPGLTAIEWTSDVRPEKPLWVAGVIFGRGRFSVHLSDGRVLTEKDGLVEWIDRRGVVVEGQRVPMRPVTAKTEESSPAPVKSGEDLVTIAPEDVTALAPPIVRTEPRT